MPLISITLASSQCYWELADKQAPPPPSCPGRHFLPKQIITGRTRSRVKPSETSALPLLPPESCRKWLRLYPLRPDRLGDPGNNAFPSPGDWSDFPVCIAEVTSITALILSVFRLRTVPMLGHLKGHNMATNRELLGTHWWKKEVSRLQLCRQPVEMCHTYSIYTFQRRSSPQD